MPTLRLDDELVSLIMGISFENETTVCYRLHTVCTYCTSFDGTYPLYCPVSLRVMEEEEEEVEVKW